MGGTDGFGMKLDAVNWIRNVSYSHDGVFVLNMGGDFKNIRDFLGVSDKRMIAHAFKGTWNFFKNSRALVFNDTGFAVKNLGGADDFTAEGINYPLMTETDAENRNFWAEFDNYVVTYPEISRVFRSAGSGRNYDAAGLKLVYFGECNLIVTENNGIGFQFP